MQEHCLRPEFTYQLLESLQQGENINLIGPHGQGRRRTLQDLRSILPESWRVFQMDMRDIEKRKSSLLNELFEQEKIESISNIHECMSALNETSIYHLIVIHNFDLLTDLNVIYYLNEIKIYPYLLLLCVSEEKKTDAALSATDCILPMVTSKQLLAEIKLRDFGLGQGDLLLLTSFLLQQTSPYSLLDTKPPAWFSDGLWKRGA